MPGLGSGVAATQITATEAIGYKDAHITIGFTSTSTAPTAAATDIEVSEFVDASATNPVLEGRSHCSTG